MGIPNKDEVEGKYRKAKGAVKQRVGRTIDDPELEDEGKSERSAGEVQDTLGRARRKVGDAIQEVGKKVGR